jgi:hypothetical protein
MLALVLHDGDQMQSDRSLVQRYRKRAEEIRTFASGVTASQDRITLLQLAEEFDLAANEQEIRAQTNQSVH